MLSVGIIHSSCWLGYELMNIFLPKVLDCIDCIALGIPVGVTVINWVFYFLRKLRTLDSYTGIFVLIFTYIVCFILNRIFNKKARKIRPLYFETIGVFILIFIVILFFCFISYLYNGIYTTGTVYSDIPFHMSLISSISYGANHGTGKFITPFYAGETLRYSIVPDFYSSILISSGNASMRSSYALPTLLMLISLVIAFLSLFRYFSRERFVPELALVFWFLAGGVGWKWWFVPKCRENNNTNFVHSLCGDEAVFWIHSFIHFLLPQRSAVFSMTINIYILLLLNVLVDSDLQDRKAALSAGIIMGLLPMISAHSFIALGEYAIFVCILNFHWKSPKRWIQDVITWACYGVLAIIIALPQIYSLLSGHKREMFSLEPIWTETNKNTISGAFLMWWNSLGGFVIIALFFSWSVLSKHQQRVYLPSIFVFIISNFVRYQPGAMDNTKVFLSCWFPLACACVSHFFIVNFNHQSKNMKIIRALIIIAIVVICIPGALCIKRSSRQIKLFSKKTESLGKWFIQYAEKGTTILTSMWHSNPAMAVGGHFLFMGYPGWAMTHGFPFREKIIERNSLLYNMGAVDEFRKRNIKYVVIDLSQNDIPGFVRPTEAMPWIKIFQFELVTVYKILTTSDQKVNITQ